MNVQLHTNLCLAFYTLKLCFWYTNLCITCVYVTTDYLSRLTKLVCNHKICLHRFCVIITEMLFTQNNVYIVNFHYISLQGNRDSGAAFEGKRQQLAFEMSEIRKDHILPSEKIYKMVLMNIAT